MHHLYPILNLLRALDFSSRELRVVPNNAFLPSAVKQLLIEMGFNSLFSMALTGS